MKVIDPRPCLVVAPKYVAEFTWPNDVKKFDDFKDLSITVLVGTATERLEALNTPADIYCINFENLQWLLVNKPKNLVFKKCIIDESTKVKNYRLRKGSIRARSLLHLVKNAYFLVELTGTPGSNGLLDLWGQLYFLDYGTRLGSTFGAFQQRWFVPPPPGNLHVAWKPGPSAANEIPAAVKDICLSLSAKDYFPVDSIIKVKIEVELPIKVRSLYEKFRKEMVLQLENNTEIRAFNAASKTLKCLQIASGAIYDDEIERTWTILHDEKLDALESIVEEVAGETLIVAYHFKHDVVRIKKRFPKAVIFKDEKNVVNRWNNSDIGILIAHPASMGHGLNLQDGGCRIVFFSHWWSPEEKQQIVGRIGPLRQMQSNHPRPVFQYDIVARGTVDEDVLYSHENKLGIDRVLKLITKGK
jgi:SNF2 family DNA or RNA helicase